MKSNCSGKDIYLITVTAALPPLGARRSWRTLKLPDSHSKRTLCSKSIESIITSLMKKRAWVKEPKLIQTPKSIRIEGYMFLPPISHSRAKVIYRIRQL